MRRHMSWGRRFNADAYDCESNTCPKLKLAFQCGFCFGVFFFVCFHGTYYSIFFDLLMSKIQQCSLKKRNNGPNKGAELRVNLLNKTVCCPQTLTINSQQFARSARPKQDGTDTKRGSKRWVQQVSEALKHLKSCRRTLQWILIYTIW